MADEKQMTVEKAHEYFAVETNNATWNLVEKPDRSAAEDMEMVHQAHASAFHWSKAGEPVNLVRAHYLVAKVYFALGMPESAGLWAEKAWNRTVELGLESWDYAFGCEIMARAHASRGERQQFADLHQKAISAIAELGPQDASLCQGELDRGPWFGMK